jgi:hypothetical protein
MLVVVGALSLPPNGNAATVQTEENVIVGSRMTFAAAAGEANRVSIALISQTPTQLTYRIDDAGAPLVAGAGCRGGGASGTPATCTMGVSAPTSCHDCPPHPATIAVTLGDGDDVLDSTAIPADDGGGGLFSVNVDTAAGADSINTGLPMTRSARARDRTPSTVATETTRCMLSPRSTGPISTTWDPAETRCTTEAEPRPCASRSMESITMAKPARETT